LLIHNNAVGISTLQNKLQWFLNLRYCSMGGET
jgi:hypothetical protein